MERIGTDSNQRSLTLYAQFSRAAIADNWDSARTYASLLQLGFARSENPADRSMAQEVAQVCALQQGLTTVQSERQTQSDRLQRTAPTLRWLSLIVDGHYNQQAVEAEDERQPRYPIWQRQARMQRYLLTISSYIERGEADTTQAAMQLFSQNQEEAHRELDGQFRRMFGDRFVLDLVETESIEDPAQQAIARRRLAQRMLHAERVDGATDGVFSAIAAHNQQLDATVSGYNYQSLDAALGRYFSPLGSITDLYDIRDAFFPCGGRSDRSDIFG